MITMMQQDYLISQLDEPGQRIRAQMQLFSQRQEEVFAYIDEDIQSRFHRLHTDICYAVKQIITWRHSRLPHENVRSRKLLEIGPGKNLALALFYAQYGAEVWTNDSYEIDWSDGYYKAFYRALLFALPEMTILREVLKNGNVNGIIKTVKGPIQEAGFPSGLNFDYIISNAVLEHVMNLPQAFNVLYGVTLAGGKHIHKIDLRYHYLLSRPLDHLLYAPRKINSLRQRGLGSLGCVWRNAEIIDFIKQAGFTKIEIKYPECIADQNYFNSFAESLRNSACPYKNWPDDDLRILGAVYCFEKNIS